MFLNSIRKKTISFLFIFIVSVGIFASPIFSLQGTLRAEAQTTSNEVVTSTADGFGDCGLDVACIVGLVIYVTVFETSQFFAITSAKLLDYFVGYSISREAYTSSNIMSEGWKVIRDLVNIIFIFILLYVAFLTTLGQDQVKSKQLFIRVLIVAMAINFSLFISRVIIDSSNALSHVFYNEIEIKEVTFGTGVTKIESSEKYKTLALQVVDHAKPQKILTAVFNRSGSSIGSVDHATFIKNGRDGGIQSFLLIYLVASALNIFMIYVFLSIAFLFVTRVVSLWLYTIFSPIAFATYATPKMGENIKYFGWKSWWENMLRIAFMAPIFIFLMYLIIQFLSITPPASGDGLNVIPSILFPPILTFVLLFAAKKIAEDYSGEFAVTAVASVNKFAQRTIMGGTAIVARTGVSAISRGFIGKEREEKLKAQAEKGGAWGFLAKRVLDVKSLAGRSTYDIRNIPGMSKMGTSKSGVKSESDYQKVQSKKASDRAERYGFTGTYKEASRQFIIKTKRFKKQMQEFDELELSLKSVGSKLKQLDTTWKSMSPADRAHDNAMEDEIKNLKKEELRVTDALKTKTTEKAVVDEELKKLTAQKTTAEKAIGGAALPWYELMTGPRKVRTEAITKKLSKGKEKELEDILKKVVAASEKK